VGSTSEFFLGPSKPPHICRFPCPPHPSSSPSPCPPLTPFHSTAFARSPPPESTKFCRPEHPPENFQLARIDVLKTREFRLRSGRRRVRHRARRLVQPPLPNGRRPFKKPLCPKFVPPLAAAPLADSPQIEPQINYTAPPRNGPFFPPKSLSANALVLKTYLLPCYCMLTPAA